MHEGIAEDGSRLYPAFPYASYTLLADADVLLIKALPGFAARRYASKTCRTPSCSPSTSVG